MKLPAFVFLFLSSVAVSTAHAETGTLAGCWRGTFNPGSENVIAFAPEEGAGTSCPADALGQPVRVEVRNLGTFQGTLHADVLEGTFTDGAERHDMAPEPDFLQLVR